MSTPNLDSRYTTPAQVDTKIANQATIDAGQYASYGLSALGLPDKWVPVVERVGAPAQSGQLSSGKMYGAYRLQHKVLVHGGVSIVRAQYVNWQAGGYTGEADGVNTVTVRASLELGDGSLLPAYFNGARDVILAPGASAWCDPIIVNHKGDTDTYAYFWSRTLISVTSTSMTWGYTTTVSGTASPNGARPGEGVIEGTTAYATDYTVTGSITVANNYGYGPIAILGQTTDRTPITGLIGDSILRGAADQDATQDGFAANGFASRRFTAAKIPHIKMGNAGDRVAGWLDTTKSGRRRAFMPGVTNVICQYGVNDLYGGGNSATTVETNLLKAWSQQVLNGAKVWQTTITPVATSTDQFVTTANQTPFANNTARVTVNDWIRAGAPIAGSPLVPVAVGTNGALIAGQLGHPLSGYFDVADACESARNSGVWKVTGASYGYVSSDGLHPNTAMHLLMAAKIDLSALGY